MTDETQEQQSADEEQQSSDEQQQSSDNVGIEEAGFESRNNSREETEAIMEAESPDDVDKDLLEEIESERQERLDPDNRPENAEVDNTPRTFIAEEARFEDHELSEEEKDDGVGQKEPDPETQAGSSDDAKDETTDDSSDDSSDGDTSTDTDGEAEATQQEAESDASTGPEPSPEPGRHKA
jgi:hypothetical protein